MIELPMRFLRSLLQPRKRGRRLKSRTKQERLFKMIWHQVSTTADYHFPVHHERADVLILQMGKVASVSLTTAINHRGLNGFHCHKISVADQQATVKEIVEGPQDLHLAGHRFWQLTNTAALSLLIGWYRENHRRNGNRLKVVTLTRDPVTWYQSSFIQRLPLDLAGILAWRRSRGFAVESTTDEAEAVAAFIAELFPLAAASHPSGDLGAAHATGLHLAAQAGQHEALFAHHFRRFLAPLEWFDEQIRPTFGLDVLAAPGLRDDGYAILENNYAEIIAVRLEDLARHVPTIGRFLGLDDFALPRRNITAKKPMAAALEPVFKAAFNGPEGLQLANELRRSRYGRACGYDLPANPERSIST